MDKNIHSPMTQRPSTGNQRWKYRLPIEQTHRNKQTQSMTQRPSTGNQRWSSQKLIQKCETWKGWRMPLRRGRETSELEANLIYKTSSRTGSATQRNPVSKGGAVKVVIIPTKCSQGGVSGRNRTNRYETTKKCARVLKVVLKRAIFTWVE